MFVLWYVHCHQKNKKTKSYFVTVTMINDYDNNNKLNKSKSFTVI